MSPGNTYKRTIVSGQPNTLEDVGLQITGLQALDLRPKIDPRVDREIKGLIVG